MGSFHKHQLLGLASPRTGLRHLQKQKPTGQIGQMSHLGLLLGLLKRLIQEKWDQLFCCRWAVAWAWRRAAGSRSPPESSCVPVSKTDTQIFRRLSARGFWLVVQPMDRPLVDWTGSWVVRPSRRCSATDATTQIEENLLYRRRTLGPRQRLTNRPRLISCDSSMTKDSGYRLSNESLAKRLEIRPR